MEHNNKEYVVFSNPTGDGPSKSAARYRGVLRIGEVQEDDSIKWLTSNVIERGRFAYENYHFTRCDFCCRQYCACDFQREKAWNNG